MRKFLIVGVLMSAAAFVGCSDNQPLPVAATDTAQQATATAQSGLDSSDALSAVAGAAVGYAMANKSSNQAYHGSGYAPSHYSRPVVIKKKIIKTKVINVYKAPRRTSSYSSRGSSRSSSYSSSRSYSSRR